MKNRRGSRSAGRVLGIAFGLAATFLILAQDASQASNSSDPVQRRPKSDVALQAHLSAADRANHFYSIDTARSEVIVDRELKADTARSEAFMDWELKADTARSEVYVDRELKADTARSEVSVDRELKADTARSEVFVDRELKADTTRDALFPESGRQIVTMISPVASPELASLTRLTLKTPRQVDLTPHLPNARRSLQVRH